MDSLWLSIAFVFGLLVKIIGLPPMVGYLIAGFVLHQLGAEPHSFIPTISEIGITLLLFTIGLKFKIKDLLRKEIWLGASIYTFSTIVIYSITIFIFSILSIYFFTDLELLSIILIAFAMSFSSTVFAMKTLEEKGEVQSFHGRVSIGVLIIQDVLAVIFISMLSLNNISLFLMLLPIILFVLRPLLMKIFHWIGHGELLTLFGIFLALVVGPELFKIFGLKADLGALVLGMLIAENKKSNELASILGNFKDIFLIGFFLSIGLSGFPQTNAILATSLLLLLIPIKTIIYFFIFTKFKLRARTSFHATITLSSFSEFGLIVLSVGVSSGLITNDWLTIFAILLSISFIILSPISTKAHDYYSKLKEQLRILQSEERLKGDELVDIGKAEILVFGLGRVGITVYNQLTKKYGQKVLGIDFDEDVVAKFREAGNNVVLDDSTDSEFWEGIESNKMNQVKLVMLCFHDFSTILITNDRLNEIKFSGIIAALADHDDEVKELKERGIQFPFNFYNEAGVGFADMICDFVGCELE